MPVPIILGGIALASAAYGAKKGYDAYEKNSDAKDISWRAERDYKNEKERTEEKQRETSQKLEDFGKLKIEIFSNEIKTLIDHVKKCKKAKSEFASKKYFTQAEIEKIDTSVKNSLEIATDLASGVGSGAVAGALTGVGAYGAVGTLASASTGTAIASLSGAAATNATLAWLGGGSLAAGGGGMALGTAVLGGIVAGPVIAVAGMFMDSRAEENLTKAKEVKAEAEKAVEQMRTIQTVLGGVQDRVDELESAISKMRENFREVESVIRKVPELVGLEEKATSFCENKDFVTFMVLGKGLKDLLDIPVLDENGEANRLVTEQIEEVLEIL
jgi:flagellin-like hook-associated protein FlgL